MLTCIHSAAGLCAACQAERAYDPDSWDEYGDHPAGIARSAELWRDMAARPEPPEPNPDDPL